MPVQLVFDSDPDYYSAAGSDYYYSAVDPGYYSAVDPGYLQVADYFRSAELYLAAAFAAAVLHFSV